MNTEASKELECANCGDTFRRYKSDIYEPAENHFCCKDCHVEYQKSEEKKPEECAAYTGGKVELTCETCGKNYERYPSKAKRGKGTYCSRKCAGKANSKERDTECYVCGNIIDKMPSRLNRGQEDNVCSKECKAKLISEKSSGPKSPQWKGGVSYHPRNYGYNWKEQKEKALKRYRNCFLCSDKEDLVVHHKKPLRFFDKTDKEWCERANSLENLIVLCRSCHSKVHHREEETNLVKLE